MPVELAQTVKLTKRNLAGKEHLTTVTDLLQRIRREDAYAGLYEAADLQWWWRKDHAAPPEHQIYWFNEQDQAIASLLLHNNGDEWNNDFMWLPSARAVVDEFIIPEVVANLVQLEPAAMLSVGEDDLVLQRALQAEGFALDTSMMGVTELARDPARSPLPAGFHLTSRREDHRPHHLSRRSGEEVATRLQECSLYRPDLDLCIRDEAGTVAAYALFWMDDVTKVGLLEPLRTEREFQRLGLARYLIAEGVARLRALGATYIRVAYDPANEPAAHLYHQMGFVDIVKVLEYRRST